MRHTIFEALYGYLGFITSTLLLYFALLMWLDRTVPKPFVWFFYLTLGLPFLILDVLYNVVVGTIIFGKWPPDMRLSLDWRDYETWLFTHRLKVYDQDPAQWKFVMRFKDALNENDPGHV